MVRLELAYPVQPRLVNLKVFACLIHQQPQARRLELRRRAPEHFNHPVKRRQCLLFGAKANQIEEALQQGNRVAPDGQRQVPNCIDKAEGDFLIF